MKSIAYRDRASLPPLPGIYYVYARRKLLYVGISKNLHERWTDNFGFGKHHRSAQLEKLGASRIEYRVINNPQRLQHSEALAILKHRPPLNKRIEKPHKLLVLQDRLADWLVRTVASGIVITCLWRFVLPMLANWLITQ